MINGFEFQYPYFLFLLIIIPLIILWQYYYNKKRYTSIKYSQLHPFDIIKDRKSIKIKLRLLPDILRYIIFVLLIIVVSRPLSSLSKDKESVEGIDIVLSLDISSSMLAEDFKPNRLEAAKNVAKDFVIARKSDNIGLVVFSGEAFTQCPLTNDKSILIELLEKVESGMISDGTAIGDGIATSINRIKDTKTKSKVIILLTDGINNMGSIDPLTAAELAKNYNIKLYTIGVGKIGMAPYPIQTPFGKQYQQLEAKIDEPFLTKVAEITGGKYYRSTNLESLKSIFNEIDQMEKTKIDISYYKQKKDLSFPILYISLILIIIEILLRKTYFKKVV